MKRILLALLLLGLPLAVLADGMVAPPIAYPAQVTIPDQRALIYFTNGVERLVIETRFTGAGTNFAWVVPLPSHPVIEEATTGLFPTLEYLFRPEIIHNVPRYYIGILLTLGFAYLFWRAMKSIKSIADAFQFVFFLGLLAVLAAMLLPALAAGKKGGVEPSTSPQPVSILDRKLVGIFETATIFSREPKALENWLHENGFWISTNAAPVIASYVKDGWMFVAAKVHRDNASQDTSTPHPLSFTFKTDKPVYPMRLTGLNSPSLTVALYVFGNTRAAAPHFKVESCTRQGFTHPLLRQWIGDAAVVTKLTATLSPAEMRKDVWLDLSSRFSEKNTRLFSWQGALTTALNWGAGVFAAGLLVISYSAIFSARLRPKLPRLFGNVTLISIVLVGLVYLFLPKIEVTLVRGHHYYYQSQKEMLALASALDDFDWHTAAEVRTGFQKLISNPTNAVKYGLQNWDNDVVGGQFREEDSPGNYLLRETNNQLQLILFYPYREEQVWDTLEFPARH